MVCNLALALVTLLLSWCSGSRLPVRLLYRYTRYIGTGMEQAQQGPNQHLDPALIGLQQQVFQRMLCPTLTSFGLLPLATAHPIRQARAQHFWIFVKFSCKKLTCATYDVRRSGLARFFWTCACLESRQDSSELVS